MEGEKMYLIISKSDRSVLGFDSEIRYQENGYPVLVNENIAFVSEDVDVIEAENIPDDLENDKYCYAERLGFYENPDYVKPNEYGLPEEIYEEIFSKGYEKALMDLAGRKR